MRGFSGGREAGLDDSSSLPQLIFSGETSRPFSLLTPSTLTQTQVSVQGSDYESLPHLEFRNLQTPRFIGRKFYFPPEVCRPQRGAGLFPS